MYRNVYHFHMVHTAVHTQYCEYFCGLFMHLCMSNYLYCRICEYMFIPAISHLCVKIYNIFSCLLWGIFGTTKAYFVRVCVHKCMLGSSPTKEKKLYYWKPEFLMGWPRMVDHDVNSCAAVRLNIINMNHKTVNSVALCEVLQKQKWFSTGLKPYWHISSLRSVYFTKQYFVSRFCFRAWSHPLWPLIVIISVWYHNVGPFWQILL